MKPNIFLSHSSRDQAVLSELKARLELKTGRAVQLFLSTDGQSIPLGRNWVHRIEQALEDAALMLVFLSPSSVTSPWVHFEAGYAFSKGVRVVPIAFGGFDIARLTPPLSLLQGFNLFSADGMNNVVALINQQFDLSFHEDFAEADYLAVFGSAGHAVTDAVAHMDEIKVTVQGEIDSLLEAARTWLKASKTDFVFNDSSIRTFGAVFEARSNPLPLQVEVLVDPALFEHVRPGIDAMLSKRSKAAEMTIKFSPQVGRVRDFHKMTALLYGTDAQISTRGSFRIGSAIFEVSSARPYNPHLDEEQPEAVILKCYLDQDTVGSLPFETAELLWRRSVLRLSI